MLEMIIQNATEDELRVLVRVLQRANAKPAVVVTVAGRRYVVSQEDEGVFDRIPTGLFEPPKSVASVMTGFGARWLRGYGRVDEMYRSLTLSQVSKVERLDRSKVWEGKSRSDQLILELSGEEAS